MTKYLVVLNTIHGNIRVTILSDSEKNAVAQATGMYCTAVLLGMMPPSDLDMTDESGQTAVEAMGLTIGAVETI